LEKIMSKSNDTSRHELTINDLNRELRDNELDGVSGGYIGETEKNLSSGTARLQVKDSHDRYA
jgi:hypothetical protein